MGCFVQFTDPEVCFNFVENKYKQKMLIAALIRYSELDIYGISEILDIDADRLIRIKLGLEFLDQKDAEELGRLFLILFSD